jgi:small subunit ribosomal protein S17
MAKKTDKQREKTKNLVGTRGRTFKGTVTKVFPTRVVIEFERTIYIPKYERYQKKKSKLHAKLPEGMKIELGDYIKIQETRPLSKIIHFKVLGKISKEDKK